MQWFFLMGWDLKVSTGPNSCGFQTCGLRKKLLVKTQIYMDPCHQTLIFFI